LWEFLLRDYCLPLFRKLAYRARNLITRQGPSDAHLYAALKKACTPDEHTRQLMTLLHHESLALDGCFEIVHSFRYGGWHRDDIRFEHLGKIPSYPVDIKSLAASHPPEPPNNGKYQLVYLRPDSSEDPFLRIRLAPTDYFSTYPVQQRLFVPVLSGDDGPCSPISKYGTSILNFESSQLPNIVCCHVVVRTKDNYLLLTQRHSGPSTDWHKGSWSCSYEEQMTVKIGEPRNDRDFHDAIVSGLEEEIGVHESDIVDSRVLSLTLEATANVVVAIGLVKTTLTMKDLEPAAEWEAEDGIGREIKRIDGIPFTIDSIVAALVDDVTQTVSRRSIVREAWHCTSRMRMLSAALHTFGVQSVANAIIVRCSQRDG
jgi:hypothetical protein